MQSLNLKQLQIYQDGANIDDVKNTANEKIISGYTTNPSLMSKENFKSYEQQCRLLASSTAKKPISFEVFADDIDQIIAEASIISTWGENVFVKVPCINTRGESCSPAIKHLSELKIKLNITAVFTENQVDDILGNLNANSEAIISVFAGRIADTGVDPVPLISKCVEKVSSHENFKILWASPREILNLYQARDCGCHIITMTPDLIKKISLFNKSLEEFSQETVKMFFDDANAAGLSVS